MMMILRGRNQIDSPDQERNSIESINKAAEHFILWAKERGNTMSSMLLNKEANRESKF
jgi:hypothetical protein